MSDVIVKGIVETLIEDNWALTETDWDGVKYSPKRGVAFSTPMIDEVDVIKKGPTCYKRIYDVTIEVRVPKNTGTETIASFTQALKDLFEGYEEGNFYCLKAQTVRIGNSRQWYQKNVVCRCHYKEYK